MIIQRNVQIIEDVLIQDIDTGFVYMNIGRHKETSEEGEERIIADYQFRVELPVDFDVVISELSEDVNISFQNDISNIIDGAGLRSNDIDATIQKLAESSAITPIVQLSEEPRTEQSDEAVELLTEKGTVIITNL